MSNIEFLDDMLKFVDAKKIEYSFKEFILPKIKQEYKEKYLEKAVIVIRLIQVRFMITDKQFEILYNIAKG